MTDWQKYWAKIPSIISKTDYLRQVGHTINGQPYTEQQFQGMVSGICQRLELKEGDSVLDLCCGNGILTIELAKRCREVLGVDFSHPLLEIAKQYHSAANLSYEYLNVMELDCLLPAKANQFNKILMYGALQHLKKSDLHPLLSRVLQLATEDVIILFGGVPDQARKGNFYPSAKQKVLYWFYQLTGKDRIGTWWDESDIQAVCKQISLQCQFEKESLDRPGGQYRFDAKIRKRTPG